MFKIVEDRACVNLKEAKKMVVKCFKSGLVPLVSSHPGMGKSDMYKEIAKEFGLKFIDIRLTNYDPTGILGFPLINEKTQRSSYLPPEMFPLKGDPIPEGYKGWLILFDELPSAPLLVQAAAYQVLLDRTIGSNELHPNVVMGAAGNLMSSNAIVNPLGTALQSRLIHINLYSDKEGWIDHATERGFDQRIIAYVAMKGIANDFNPEHTDCTFMCERTLEFLNKLVKDSPKLDLTDLPLIAGTIGLGQAREFITFTQVYQEIPTIHQILSNPLEVKVPDDQSSCFALAIYISKEINESNIDQAIKYIKRLGIEFQSLILKRSIAINPKLLNNPEVTLWALEHAKRVA